PGTRHRHATVIGLSSFPANRCFSDLDFVSAPDVAQARPATPPSSNQDTASFLRSRSEAGARPRKPGWIGRNVLPPPIVNRAKDCVDVGRHRLPFATRHALAIQAKLVPQPRGSRTDFVTLSIHFFVAEVLDFCSVCPVPKQPIIAWSRER